MATIHLDIIDGASGRETFQGLQLRRKAILTGLTGPAARRIVTALDPSSRFGVPSLGSMHPYASIMCIEREAVALDSGTVEINLLYGVPDTTGGGGQLPPEVGEPPQLTVGATLQTIETNIDANRNRIKVSYTPKPTAAEPNPKTIEQTPTLSLQVPLVVVDFSRRENASPLNKALRNVGRINSVAIGEFARKTLLCSAIVGTTRDSGATYDVRYEFQATDLGGVIQTWDVTVLAIDPETGQPFKDINTATLTIDNPVINGAALVQMFPALDFTPLNLELPTPPNKGGRVYSP